MRKCALIMIAATAIGLIANHASAADIARRPPPPPAYVPPAPIPYIWTGCYVGGNVGGAWSNVEIDSVSTGGTASASNSGVAGGGLARSNRHRSYDVGLNHYVSRAANHEKMLDIVSANEHEASARVDAGNLDQRKPRLPTSERGNTEPACTEAPHHIKGTSGQTDNDHKRE